MYIKSQHSIQPQTAPFPLTFNSITIICKPNNRILRVDRLVQRKPILVIRPQQPRIRLIDVLPLDCTPRRLVEADHPG